MTTRHFRKALLTVAFAVSAVTTGCATAPAPVTTASALARPTIAERRQCVSLANDSCYAEHKEEGAIDDCLATRISACESGRSRLLASAGRP